MCAVDLFVFRPVMIRIELYYLRHPLYYHES